MAEQTETIKQVAHNCGRTQFRTVVGLVTGAGNIQWKAAEGGSWLGVRFCPWCGYALEPTIEDLLITRRQRMEAPDG